MIETKNILFVESDKADAGNTTVITVATGYRVRVHGVSITADTTLTGDVHALIGSTQITPLLRNALAGGLHQLMPLSSRYIEGADGEDVVLNNSQAEDLSYIVHYNLVPS